MKKHLIRERGRPPTEFANEGEVSDADAAALPSATGREEGLAQDEPLSDFEAEVQGKDPGGPRMSEVTGAPEPGTNQETDDGLDDVAEALRSAAEGPMGRREKL
jgi:hypothetical protein